MSTPHHLAAQRLAAQFGWHLLAIPDWVAAACQIDPAPADDKAARNACLTVYSQALYGACQDKNRQEQAYSELHHYLWPQAYHRDPELAADALQITLIKIFEGLQASDPTRGPQADVVFLRFSQIKLLQAIRDERRRRLIGGRVISLDQPVMDDAEQVSTLADLLADASPSQEERIIADEDRATRRRWLDAASPRLASMVIESLQDLWTNRLKRQISAVVFTYLDQADDAAIAVRLNTKSKNIQPLRSRGLDKVREQLHTRRVYGQGGPA